MSSSFRNTSSLAQIRLQLFRSKPAVAGLCIICLLHLIALPGYLVMPDATPNANDGAVQIRKQPPGFSVTVLKLRKDVAIEKRGFLQMMLQGEESAFTIIPIQGVPEVTGDSIFFKSFGREKARLSLLLLDCVKPVMVGPGKLPGQRPGINWYARQDTLHYLAADGARQQIARQELERVFWQGHVEERTFWLGTDKSGRDILSRMILGARISLSIGFVATLISVLLGFGLGALAGYFGGKTDLLVDWLMTVTWSVPALLLVMLLGIVTQARDLWVVFLATGLTLWVEVARVTRSQMVNIKHRLFIDAARLMGFSNRRIIVKHFLPNIIAPVLTVATCNFATAILVEAGLSFLGLGVQPPAPSWGGMVYEGFQSIGTSNSWHLVTLPGLAIVVTVLAFNMLGNGLKSAVSARSSITGRL